MKNKSAKFRNDKDLFEILKGTSITFVIKVFGSLVGFLVMILITRGYGESGQDVFGKYLLGLLVLRIFLIIGKFGADTALLRFVSGFNALNLLGNARKVYRKAILHILPIGIILSAVMYFSASFFSEQLGVPKHYVECLAFLILPYSWFFVNTQSLRGLKDMVSFAFFFNTSVTLFAGIVLVVLFVLNKDLFLSNPTWPIYAFSIGIAISFIFSLILWNKKSKGEGFEVAQEVSNKSFLNVAIPLMLAQSISFIMGWTDQLMLGKMMTTADVGVYGAAFKFSTLSVIFLAAVNSIAAPKISELKSQNDIAGIEKVVKHSTKLIFWVTLPIVAVLCLFPELVLSVSGPSFVAGAGTLIILSLGKFFSSISGSVGTILQMTGLQKYFQNILLLAAAINVVLNYLLIPYYGIEGAAIASLACVVFWNSVMVIVVKRKFGFYSIYIPGVSR
jgi:O-antigen/teichoic acid export membrane protein